MVTYRYGQPVELHPGTAPDEWLLYGTQESWENYQLDSAESKFRLDVLCGVANTEQHQLMSTTFLYDPHYGVVPDFPF